MGQRGKEWSTMRRATLLIAFAVALAMIVAVPAAGLGMIADEGTDATNETNTNETAANGTAPGEQLSGVIGVQEAEIEGDVDKRTFDIKVAQAQTQEAQADVVATQLGNVEERLNALEERKAELDQQRADGEISEGKYRAEIARVAAQTETATQLTNQSEQTAGELPEHLLTERNVSAEQIQTLKDRAGELSGPEVAEIARGIAGPGIGQTPADQRPVDVPDRPERPGDDRPGDDRTDDDRPDDDRTDDDRPDDEEESDDAGDEEQEDTNDDRTDGDDQPDDETSSTE